ncbi:hypothetical protein J2847_001925 [Azospirillum agricola]|uniref:hypothetical protein n=1 Tax=Azospirillum agricola TaxID=1720247 RepID=UPI001AE801DD|nr:hypothetical protein [Azospirillum agricola]MBP2228634.1 hypothetical protein [Azospirillum agricola]
MQPAEIELSAWVLLTVAGEDYLIGHSEQTGAVLLSAPLVDLDSDVTPQWAVADGGTRYRLAPSRGLRSESDRQEAAALLADSLAAWGIPDSERGPVLQQVFGSAGP